MKYPKVKISYIADFINGVAFKPSDWSNEGMPIIRIQNLSDPKKPFNRTVRKVHERYIVHKGDILVSWSATIDVFEWEKEESLLNQHIFKVRYDSSKVVKKYFKTALKKTINDLTKFAHGSTMKHVVKRDFENHKIPLPPLDDQIRIATLLSRVESLITKRKESLQLLDEFLKSTFLEMFQIRDALYKKWNIDKLMKYAEIVSGITKGKKYKTKKLIEIPYMRVANVQDGYFDLEEIKTIPATLAEIDKYKLLRGDILLTEGGDPDKLGRGAVWEEQISKCIHQNHIFRVRLLDLNRVNANYLSALIGSIYGKSYFLKAAKQTTGIASINSTQLKNFPLIIPPIELQNEYSVIADKVEDLKSFYQKHLIELECLYGALSQKAFKGELDLSKIPLEKSTEDEIADESMEVLEQISKPDVLSMPDPMEPEKILRII